MMLLSVDCKYASDRCSSMLWAAIRCRYKRTSLQVLGTVGEPINPEAWLFYYNVIGDGRCSIADTWWQTETVSVRAEDDRPVFAYAVLSKRFTILPGRCAVLCCVVPCCVADTVTCMLVPLSCCL